MTTHRRGRNGAAEKLAAGDLDTPVSRILYLPEGLVDAMQRHRRRSGLTNTQLVLRALNAHWKEVDDLARAEQQAPSPGEGDLFSDAELGTAQNPTRRQVEITPTGRQLTVIDPLVQTTAAKDRSHLIALVLRAHLEAAATPPGKAKPRR